MSESSLVKDWIRPGKVKLGRICEGGVKSEVFSDYG